MCFGNAYLRAKLEKYSDGELENMINYELMKPTRKINENAVRLALQILRERDVPDEPIPEEILSYFEQWKKYYRDPDRLSREIAEEEEKETDPEPERRGRLLIFK